MKYRVFFLGTSVLEIDGEISNPDNQSADDQERIAEAFLPIPMGDLMTSTDFEDIEEVI